MPRRLADAGRGGKLSSDDGSKHPARRQTMTDPGGRCVLSLQLAQGVTLTITPANAMSEAAAAVKGTGSVAPSTSALEKLRRREAPFKSAGGHRSRSDAVGVGHGGAHGEHPAQRVPGPPSDDAGKHNTPRFSMHQDCCRPTATNLWLPMIATGCGPVTLICCDDGERLRARNNASP
jgi:hypothetical protein